MKLAWICCIGMALVHIAFRLDATPYVAATFILGGLISEERKNGR